MYPTTKWQAFFCWEIQWRTKETNLCMEFMIYSKRKQIHKWNIKRKAEKRDRERRGVVCSGRWAGKASPRWWHRPQTGRGETVRGAPVHKTQRPTYTLENSKDGSVVWEEGTKKGQKWQRGYRGRSRGRNVGLTESWGTRMLGLYSEPEGVSSGRWGGQEFGFRRGWVWKRRVLKTHTAIHL